MGFQMMDNFVSVGKQEFHYDWYDDRKARQICDEVESNASESGITEEYLMSLVKGDLEDYRKVCTFIQFKTSLELDWYDVKLHIVNACIDKFKSILGEKAASLYYYIRKNAKKDHKDECYKLFSYYTKPYSEQSIIKSLVTLLARFDGKPFIPDIDCNVNDIETYKSQMDDFLTCIHGKLYHKLYKINESSLNGKYLYEYRDEGDAEKFQSACKLIDIDKESDAITWETFMNHVFNHDWQKAYEMTLNIKGGRKGHDYV